MKQYFGYGIAVWAVAYLVASGFVAYQMVDTLAAQVAIILAGLIALVIASRALHATSVQDALKYSVVWLALSVVLDLLLTVPFTGWGIYSRWYMWVWYAAVLVVPMVFVKKGTVVK